MPSPTGGVEDSDCHVVIMCSCVLSMPLRFLLLRLLVLIARLASASTRPDGDFDVLCSIVSGSKGTHVRAPVYATALD